MASTAYGRGRAYPMCSLMSAVDTLADADVSDDGECTQETELSFFDKVQEHFPGILRLLPLGPEKNNRRRIIHGASAYDFTIVTVECQYDQSMFPGQSDD